MYYVSIDSCLLFVNSLAYKSPNCDIFSIIVSLNESEYGFGTATVVVSLHIPPILFRRKRAGAGI